MPTVLMSIGSVRFYSPIKDQVTPSFDTWDRDSNYSWPSQPRLMRKPAHQFTGIGEDTVTVAGVLYPHMFGGLETLTALRTLAGAGQPQPLQRYAINRSPAGSISYSAAWMGVYVIKRVQTLDKMIDSSGNPIRLDFTLELVEYGDDRVNFLMGG